MLSYPARPIRDWTFHDDSKSLAGHERESAMRDGAIQRTSLTVRVGCHL